MGSHHFLAYLLLFFPERFFCSNETFVVFVTLTFFRVNTKELVFHCIEKKGGLIVTILLGGGYSPG